MLKNADLVINKKIIEIVHNDSIFLTMKKSNLKSNEVIKISPIFSIANITNIDNYIVSYPNDLSNIIKYYDIKYYDFSENIRKINSLKNYSIRIWCSHNNADSYILLCYLVYLFKNNNSDIYVVYSDEYNSEYNTPAILNEEELFESSKLSHKLTDKEINELYNNWFNIKDKKCEIRIIRDNEIKLVDYNYFDGIIIETLRNIGTCKVSRLVGTLLGTSDDFIDLIYVMLIDKLIKNNNIKLVEKNNERYFDNIVSL